MFALAALVFLVIPGCGVLERSEELRTEHVLLDGYAYDPDLRKIGDARLDLEVEVIRRQEFRREPRLYLQGEGTLSVGDRRYTIMLPDTTPSFLRDNRGLCQNYFEGLGRRAYLDGEPVSIDLKISESLNYAYGLIELEPIPGLRRDSPGFSGVCFDEEGKTNWEIWRIKHPSFVAFTLGPDISPLEKLQEHRDRAGP